ncbi:MAG: DUF305 domain-containing protein [Gracilimonas sp.]|nr:DUF305 domain-containing protein [Gracilimonas sp.]MBO6616385.1 DUF305 domain-containing protein [Gracilimonas sp.]
MNSRFIVKFVKSFFLMVLVVGLSACKSSESVSNNSESDKETATEQSVDNDSGMTTAEMEALYWARQDSARMNFTKADVKFMTGMIAHHAQALIMSRLAPENNASPQIQTLAARIINAQKDEIRSMQTWLRDRDQPVPEVHIEGLNLMIHGLGEDHMKMDHTNMAGMLSPAQLKELSEATGEEFDRLFLKYMIDHHKGAVTMVTKLFDTDGAAQDDAAFRLASDIQVDQRTEIDRMQLMLDRMTAANGQ